MRAELFDSFETLPARYVQLLEAAGTQNIFHGLDWYKNLVANCANAGERLRLYGVSTHGAPDSALALFVARVPGHKPSVLKTAKLEEFSNFYSLEAGPILSPSLADVDDVLDCLIGAICAETPRWDIVRFGPLNRTSPVFDALIRRLRNHRMAVEPFFQHDNWFEDLNNLTFEQYIGRLHRSTKEAVRKARKLDREHDVEWTMTTDLDGLDSAMEVYQRIYSASWKEPEIYPRFIPELITNCARSGCLRLGSLVVNGEPAATQLVVMSNRNAVMLKTAYVPDLGKYSSGAVVMVHMLKHLITVDHAARYDLGAGDEPFKARWSTQRQERWGIMAYNRATARGVLGDLAVGAKKLAATLRKGKRGDHEQNGKSAGS